MPQYRRCWVPNCHNNEVTDAGRTKLFLFPRNVDRCCQWLMAIGDQTLLSCSWKQLTRSRHVCIEHFLPHMITATGRAAWNAVPLIFTDVRPELSEEVLRIFLESIPANRACAESDVTVPWYEMPESSEESSCGYQKRKEDSNKTKQTQKMDDERAREYERQEKAASLETLEDNVKQEPFDCTEDAIWNSTGHHKSFTSGVVKQEDDDEELAPFAAVFLEEVIKKEVEEEHEDSSAL